jgi:hypothetical protein
MPVSKNYKLAVMLTLFLIFNFAFFTYALALNIDSTNKFAWGENIGWINFGSTEGDVDVSSTAVDGYAWGENVGWISLTCSNTSSCATVNYGISRSGDSLSGYAWGENVGWISFSCSNTSSCGTVNYGVSVSSTTGDFSGYAWGENVGWISFNCSNTSTCGTVSYKVSTSSTATPTPTPTNGGGGRPPTPTPTATPTSSPSILPPPPPTPTPGSPTPTPSGTVLPPFPTPTTPPPTQTPVLPPPGNPPINKITDFVDTFSRRFFSWLEPIVGSVCSPGPLGTAACASTAVGVIATIAVIVSMLAQKEIVAAGYWLLQIVGLRRKEQVWGVIYDSATKKPIPLVKVELLDSGGRILETRFADRDGRYGFLTSPASLNQYELRVSIRATKPGYQIPSTRITSGTDYIVYDHLYLGGEITLRGDALINYNIPADPVSPQRVRLSGLGRDLLGTLADRLLSLGFYVGLVLVPLNYYLVPTQKNLLIMIVFFGVNALQLLVVYRPYGLVIDALTGKPLPFALVTLNDTQGNRLGFTVSDEHGRYILSAERGRQYELRAYTPANVIPQRTSFERVSPLSRVSRTAWFTTKIRV